MTKFIDKSKQVKEVKKTVFTRCLTYKGHVKTDEIHQPEDWKNVEYLGNASSYGDVFKVWDDDPEQVTIYFGIKGDEEYKSI